MALVTVPNRDKKFIIWNFMEELCENYYALENNLNTQFKFTDFYNFGRLIQYLKENGIDKSPDKKVIDTIKEYLNETGYKKIKGNMVKLPKKGLIECQKPKHEWD
jgi:hypothetical protein